MVGMVLRDSGIVHNDPGACPPIATKVCRLGIIEIFENPPAEGHISSATLLLCTVLWLLIPDILGIVATRMSVSVAANTRNRWWEWSYAAQASPTVIQERSRPLQPKFAVSDSGYNLKMLLKHLKMLLNTGFPGIMHPSCSESTFGTSSVVLASWWPEELGMTRDRVPAATVGSPEPAGMLGMLSATSAPLYTGPEGPDVGFRGLEELC